MPTHARFSFVALLTAVFIIGGCDSNPTEPKTEPPDDEVIISDETYVVKPDELELTERTDSKLTFSFSGEAPDIKTGDVVVGREDGGFLREVTKVETKDNTVTLTTSRAALVDVIEKGELTKTISFSSGGGGANLKTWSAEYLKEGVSVTAAGFELDGTVLYDGMMDGANLQVTIPEGRVAFTPDLDFHIDIDDAEVQELRTVASGQLTFNCDLAVTASGIVEGGANMTLASFNRSFVYFIGWVPVVVDVELSFIAGFHMESDVNGAVRSGFSSSASVEVGAEYSKTEGWNDIFDPGMSFQGHPIEWEGTASTQIKGYIRPVVELELYKVAGPYLYMQPYLLFEGITASPDASWTLSGGVEGKVGFAVEVFGYTLDNYNHKFDVFEPVVIATGSGGGNGDGDGGGDGDGNGDGGGQPNVIYVDADATENNSGSSWTNAFTHLQDALSQAEAGEEIWVAEGTYYPDRGEGQTQGDRDATFQLISGVELYGGFAGGESQRDQRNVEANETILSGDIDLTGEITDNSYHIVTGSGTDETAVLDGFTVTGGYATRYPDEYGGGMYNEVGSPTVVNVTFVGNMAEDGGGGMYNSDSNPTVTNVVFEDNATIYDFGGDGGGMYNDASSPAITNTTFIGNFAGDSGGGMYNTNSSNPAVANSTFRNNSADRGGGMYNDNSSSPTIANSMFWNNTANDDGGGMYNENGSNPSIINSFFTGNAANGSGGGIFNDYSSPVIIGVVFTGNSSDYGGGMYNNESGSNPLIINSAFTDNSASAYDGGGIYNDSANPEIVNTILWENSAADKGDQIYNYDSAPTISYSIVQGGLPEGSIDGGGNLDANPRFVDADGPDNIPGTPDDNVRLETGSPAINAGTNEALDLDGDGDTTDDVPADIDGDARIQNDTVDMGAYEGGH